MDCSSRTSPQILSFRLTAVAVFIALGIFTTSRFLESPKSPSRGKDHGQLPLAPPVLNLNAQSNQLVILGLDGANWAQLQPLLEQGRLPTLARLQAHGSYGHLHSLLPTISPMIWTSVATGKLPEKHGISDFTLWDEQAGRSVPATARSRKALALWNILSALHIPVGVVNWWTTWPAEPVEGFILSDLAALGRRKELERKTQTTKTSPNGAGNFYPPQLAEIEQSTFKDFSLFDELSRFAHLTEEDRSPLESLQTYEPGNPFSVLKFSVLSDRYFQDMTLEYLKRNGPPELLMYYTSSTDALSHVLWKYFQPARFPRVEQELKQRFQDTLNRYYEWVDEIFGKILAHYPPDVNVILLSDHGMIGMPDVTTGVKHSISARHTDHALVIVAGKDFQRDRVFPTRTLQGEHFERWQGSINYQERGYRNLFPQGWMETVVVTPAGTMEIEGTFEVQGSGAPLVLLWDGNTIGQLLTGTPLRIETTQGLHTLRLLFDDVDLHPTPVHPETIPWTTANLGTEQPRPFTMGEDWGYILWQDPQPGGTWHVRWSAYPGTLFEKDPVFSGAINCEAGFDYYAGTPGVRLRRSGNTLQFEHATTSETLTGGADFVPRGSVQFDLLIDGDRYRRMVFLRSIARAKVDKITLRPPARSSPDDVLSILDVTPTTLALFGLPVAADMDGKAWKEQLREEVLERQSRAFVPTYELIPRDWDASTILSEENVKKRMDYLKALGYVAQ